MNKIRMTILAVVIIVLLSTSTIALASDPPGCLHSPTCERYVFLPLVMTDDHYEGGYNFVPLLPPLSLPPFGGGEMATPMPFP